MNVRLGVAADRFRTSGRTVVGDSVRFGVTIVTSEMHLEVVGVVAFLSDERRLDGLGVTIVTWSRFSQFSDAGLGDVLESVVGDWGLWSSSRKPPGGRANFWNGARRLRRFKPRTSTVLWLFRAA